MTIKNPGYWAATLDDADRDVAQRTWTTEVSLAVRPDGHVLFGCRLHVTARGVNPAYTPSIPTLVRAIGERLMVSFDGHRGSIEPTFVDDQDGVDNLVQLILSKRKHDVIVVALPEDSIDPNQALIPVGRLARDIFGVAHISVITGPASFHLTDRLGRELSVFRGAVRTYKPGFSPETDSPFSHPLALAERILNWEGLGPAEFCRFLVQQAIRAPIRNRDLDRDHPSFKHVAQVAAQLRLEEAVAAGTTGQELADLYVEEAEKLRFDLEEQRETYDALLTEAEGERADLSRRLAEAEATISALRARVSYVPIRGAAGGRKTPPIPNSFDQLEDWARDHLSGDVVILSRALRCAKKSAFETPSLAYQTLLAFRDYYVPVKRGDANADRSGFTKELLRLGLSDEPSFGDDSRMGEQGEAYSVKYESTNLLLDRHIKGNNSRDSRYGFRVYYCWDDVSSQIVVGWLPEHLPTRAT